ncbi:MAG TPA: copper chaperone PCu(A)C [Alphaproteobacteria bacterium]|nr:copper chaperone PCu(A)C [Alphaproteobacteria bacterium]
MARSLAGMALAFLLVAVTARAPLHAKDASITVENAWARPTPAGARTAAVYLTAVNHGSTPTRIVSAETPVADRAEMHIDLKVGDTMQMRRVLGVDVPANGSTVFKPGGFHVMLIGLKAPLTAGEKIPLTLELDRGGPITVTVDVKP